MKTNLILFRNDLRIHDNEALSGASKADRLIPVYVFDPRKFTATEYGFPRVGPHRIRFLMETVHDLRKNLRLRNSDLVIRTGKAEVIVPEMVKEFGVSEVFMHTDATSEEREDEDALEKALESVKSTGSATPASVRLRKFWGSTLYHRDDLPMDLHQVPDVFSDFRKRVEKSSRVRQIIAMPDKLPPSPVDDPGELPNAKTLRALPDHFLWDDKKFNLSHKSVLDFRGGEDAALQRVKEYIWDGNHLRRYKETRTGFMSNRGRQNAASFFSWNLRQEWRIGAVWFEALLLDYDPCSNWGNWAYNSGVGNDPRQRHFNILGQADRYDKEGDYVRHWIPELAHVPPSHVHQPHLLSAGYQRHYGIAIGVDYPDPVIDLKASYEKLDSP